jgi:hypothetical protein
VLDGVDGATLRALCYVADVAIIGERPETGVRIAIERPREGGPPWAYQGTAALPDAVYPVQVSVSDAGDVGVVLAPAREGGSAPPADLAEKIRLIVRTAYRQAKSDDEAPAFRIVRWRGEK